MSQKIPGLGLAILLVLLYACAGRVARVILPSGSPAPAVSPISTAAQLPSATPTTSPTATPPAAIATAPSASPTATPNLTNPLVVTLAANLTEPDDLLVAADGTIYVSDVSEGTVRRIAGDGKTDVYLSGISEPEGMLLLADGSMIIVEQGRNRLLRWDPAAKTLAPLRDLPNPSGALGVDGIALDTRPGRPATLVIPDSPNDRLLRLTPDGRSLTVIARGLVRPTGAWVETDGSLLVVEENGGFLDRVHPNGQVEKLAPLPTPDDVVEDAAGNIFVVTLGDGALHWIDGKTHEDHVLVRGLASPQGLAIDGAGNLIVTDPGNHQVVKVMVHP
jgi:sugar lactone lactonase YvrE